LRASDGDDSGLVPVVECESRIRGGGALSTPPYWSAPTSTATRPQQRGFWPTPFGAQHHQGFARATAKLRPEKGDLARPPREAGEIRHPKQRRKQKPPVARLRGAGSRPPRDGKKKKMWEVGENMRPGPVPRQASPGDRLTAPPLGPWLDKCDYPGNTRKKKNFISQKPSGII